MPGTTSRARAEAYAASLADVWFDPEARANCVKWYMAGECAAFDIDRSILTYLRKQLFDVRAELEGSEEYWR